jgi:hypothetical protein
MKKNIGITHTDLKRGKHHLSTLTPVGMSIFRDICRRKTVSLEGLMKM